MTRRSEPCELELALFGLGGNLGDPLSQLAAATERLARELGGVRCSSVYRTAPVGFVDQPPFLNLVCAGWTALDPAELLLRAQGVERALGRERTFPNAPRTIDVDLLAVGDRVLDGPDLILPHPRMHDRAFVLVPLAEVAPGWRHPRLGRTAAELMGARQSLQGVEWFAPPFEPGKPDA